MEALSRGTTLALLLVLLSACAASAHSRSLTAEPGYGYATELGCEIDCWQP